MTWPVLLHGPLAAHRRGEILGEALGARTCGELPEGPAAVLGFAEAFQAGDAAEAARLVEWTRAPGHLAILVPPFDARPCPRPVEWRAERLEAAPRGGEGLARVLASEVQYRLTGKLQTPAVPGATWVDTGVTVGTYRVHPAAGLFAVTALPLWSLSVLDAPRELDQWLASLVALAGEARPAAAPRAVPLTPDHYGLLVFLLSRPFADEVAALEGLAASSIFRFSSERGRSLLKDLADRGLVRGATPSQEAHELVLESPYAPYLGALREVANP